MADGSGTMLERLLKSANPIEQASLREALADGERLGALRTAYFNNPFLDLSDEDAASLSGSGTLGSVESLVAARHAAMRSTAPRFAVFCMPKSGSSFTQSALGEALQLPFVSLTSFGSNAASSHFGMNGREQELDELAMIKSTLACPGGFVAQHHTRYTQYLGLQLRAYRITPILTVRNVLDCIVSFDDMMLAWRAAIPSEAAWISDPYVLPLDYPDRPAADRYGLLSRSLGLWLVQFLLSWKRGLKQDLVSPLVVRYETDILDPARFVARVSGRLRLRPDQTERLRAYALNPDREQSRLNVGKSGRGRDRVPDETCRFLMDYARSFGEFSDEELAQLFS